MRIAIIDDQGNESEVSKKVNDVANKAIIKTTKITTKTASITSKLLTIFLAKSAEVTAKLSDKLDEEYKKIK